MEEIFAVLAEAFATITLTGQLSSRAIIWGDIHIACKCPGGNIPRGRLSGGTIIRGSIIQGSIVRGAIIRARIFLGANYRRGQLSGGDNPGGNCLKPHCPGAIFVGANYHRGNFPDTNQNSCLS